MVETPLKSMYDLVELVNETAGGAIVSVINWGEP